MALVDVLSAVPGMGPGQHLVDVTRLITPANAEAMRDALAVTRTPH